MSLDPDTADGRSQADTLFLVSLVVHLGGTVVIPKLLVERMNEIGDVRVVYDMDEEGENVVISVFEESKAH